MRRPRRIVSSPVTAAVAAASSWLPDDAKAMRTVTSAMRTQHAERDPHQPDWWRRARRLPPAKPTARVRRLARATGPTRPSAQAIADSGTASGSCPPGTNGRKVATMTPLTIAHASSPLVIVPPVAGRPRAPTLPLPPSPRLTSEPMLLDTVGSALTGRHHPRQGNIPTCFGPERVRFAPSFQPGSSGAEAIMKEVAMSTSRSLPARPSLESLRKQAKKLARDTAAADVEAIARAGAQLPNADLPLTQRTAQLVIAPASTVSPAGGASPPKWPNVLATVSSGPRPRRGAPSTTTTSAAPNEVAGGVSRVALVARGRTQTGGLLGMAARARTPTASIRGENGTIRGPSARSFSSMPVRAWVPSVVHGVEIESRARGLLQLFQQKGLLPRTLDFLAALGDIDAVRFCTRERSPEGVTAAVMRRPSWSRAGSSRRPLRPSCWSESSSWIPELGKRVEESGGPPRVHRLSHARGAALWPSWTPNRCDAWQAFLMEQVMRAAQDGDVPAFAGTGCSASRGILRGSLHRLSGRRCRAGDVAGSR